MGQSRLSYKIKEEVLFVVNILGQSVITYLAPVGLIGAWSYFFPDFTPSFFPLVNKLLMFILCGIIGYKIAIDKKYSQFTAGAGFVVATISSGAIKIQDGIIITGLGNLLTAAIMGYLAVYVANKVEERLKKFSAIFTLLITLLITLPIGLLIKDPIDGITFAIGNMVEYFITLRPFFMGGLVAVIFAAVICSPLSSVALAFILAIEGISAGSASIGVSLAAVYFGVAATLTGGISPFLIAMLGGPKPFLSNIINKPIVLIPLFISAFILGGLTATLGFENTTLGAGFGVAALVGLTEAMSISSNIIIPIFYMLGLTILFSIITIIITFKLTKVLTKEDYKLNI